MPILINELRLSLVWIHAYAKDKLLPYLAHKNRYTVEFAQAKAGTGAWMLPWEAGQRQHFWEYYLYTAEIGGLDDVDAERAWQHLIPLRTATLARVTTPEGLRVTLEGYGFPHSVGVVATVLVQPAPPMSPLETVDRFVSARSADYDVKWKDGGEPTHGSLDNLAEALMDRLHQKLLGQSTSGLSVSSPISVATVIDASGVQQAASQDKAEVTRALAGLCRLHLGWKTAPVKQEDLIKDDENGDLFYQEERGRAIWMPRYFSGVTEKIRRRALGCYHRNQAFAALQTRSLLTLVRRAGEILSNKEPIPILISQPVGSAVRLLNDLYLGERVTYRSRFLINQIEHNIKRVVSVGQLLGEVWREPPPH